MPLTADISAREREILAAIGRALPNKVIASDLGIPESAVRIDVSSLLRKCAVKNRVALALLAHGIDPATGARSAP